MLPPPCLGRVAGSVDATYESTFIFILTITTQRMIDFVNNRLVETRLYPNCSATVFVLFSYVHTLLFINKLEIF